MIIVKLQGGIGNQLFQYSLGRHLAQQRQTPLKLDIRWYKKVANRFYALDRFHTDAALATDEDIQTLTGLGARVQDLLRPYYQRRFIREQSFAFDPQILACGSDVYLEGYWQSSNYFADSAALIRHDLQVKGKPNAKNQAVLRQIRATTAVALHVRRGDYVANRSTALYHGTCSPDYYRRAIATVAKRVANPHFFVFSDDPDWTRHNIPIDFPTTYVDHNGDAPHEDLRLMSQCQHFIIANSTFSWWGAWLADFPQKIVIYPKPWFNDSMQNSRDLCPKPWHAVPRA